MAAFLLGFLAAFPLGLCSCRTDSRILLHRRHRLGPPLITNLLSILYLNEKIMEKEEEDSRREAAMASSLCLQPNFNPKGVTKDQLSKFRELHRKRLQLKSKSKSKFKTKSKDVTNKKFQGYDLSSQSSEAQGLKIDDKDGECSDSQNTDSKGGGVFVPSSSKKQKLHWGLDTKERWERKSNM